MVFSRRPARSSPCSASCAATDSAKNEPVCGIARAAPFLIQPPTNLSALPLAMLAVQVLRDFRDAIETDTFVFPVIFPPRPRNDNAIGTLVSTSLKSPMLSRGARNVTQFQAWSKGHIVEVAEIARALLTPSTSCQRGSADELVGCRPGFGFIKRHRPPAEQATELLCDRLRQRRALIDSARL